MASLCCAAACAISSASTGDSTASTSSPSKPAAAATAIRDVQLAPDGSIDVRTARRMAGGWGSGCCSAPPDGRRIWPPARGIAAAAERKARRENLRGIWTAWEGNYDGPSSLRDSSPSVPGGGSLRLCRAQSRGDIAERHFGERSEHEVVRRQLERTR